MFQIQKRVNSMTWKNAMTILVLLIFASECIRWIHALSKTFGTLVIDLQNVYYLFSTAAQTISALVALLIAGFALVFNMMDGDEKEDESRAEINSRLKQHYYIEIKIISFMSALTIILNLVDLIVNRSTFSLKGDLYIISFIFDVATILLAFWFVIDMINPNKEQKTARILLKQGKKKSLEANATVNESDFTSLFIDLERQVREYITGERSKNNSSAWSPFVPFREIVAYLYRSEQINRELRDQLLEINRYRNLVFHGQVKTVDSDMYELLQNVRQQILAIINGISR